MSKKNTKKKQNLGRVFEKTFEDSVDETGYWWFRVRDVNPAALKNRFAIPRNPYDMMIHNGELLFTLELKSTQNKSFRHRGKSPQIQPHQIEALVKASKHPNIVSGLILNFRTVNKTYFLHIKDFLEYNQISKGEIENPYSCQVNEMSISLAFCEEVGIEVYSVIKRKYNRYFINDLLGNLTQLYKSGRWS